MDNNTQNYLGLLRSKTRRALLLLLFTNEDQEYYIRELGRKLSTPASMIQREIRKLNALDLLSKRKLGNLILYKINKKSSLYSIFRNLLLKTYGIAEILKPAFHGIDNVLTAFIYGSYAKETFGPTSDIDVFVITKDNFSTEDYEKINYSIAEIEEFIGREINLDLYEITEYKKKQMEHNAYFNDILSGPKIFIKGTGHGL